MLPILVCFKTLLEVAASSPKSLADNMEIILSSAGLTSQGTASIAAAHTFYHTYVHCPASSEVDLCLEVEFAFACQDITCNIKPMAVRSSRKEAEARRRLAISSLCDTPAAKQLLPGICDENANMTEIYSQMMTTLDSVRDWWSIDNIPVVGPIFDSLMKRHDKADEARRNETHPTKVSADRPYSAPLYSPHPPPVPSAPSDRIDVGPARPPSSAQDVVGSILPAGARIPYDVVAEPVSGDAISQTASVAAAQVDVPVGEVGSAEESMSTEPPVEPRAQALPSPAPQQAAFVPSYTPGTMFNQLSAVANPYLSPSAVWPMTFLPFYMPYTNSFSGLLSPVQQFQAAATPNVVSAESAAQMQFNSASLKPEILDTNYLTELLRTFGLGEAVISPEAEQSSILGTQTLNDVARVMGYSDDARPPLNVRTANSGLELISAIESKALEFLIGLSRPFTVAGGIGLASPQEIETMRARVPEGTAWNKVSETVKDLSDGTIAESLLAPVNLLDPRNPFAVPSPAQLSAGPLLPPNLIAQNSLLGPLTADPASIAQSGFLAKSSPQYGSPGIALPSFGLPLIDGTQRRLSDANARSDESTAPLSAGTADSTESAVPLRQLQDILEQLASLFSPKQETTPLSSDTLPWIPLDGIAGTLPAWGLEALVGPYAMLFEDLVEVAQDAFIRLQLVFDVFADEPIPVTADGLRDFTEKAAEAFRASLNSGEADALKSIAVTVEKLPTFLPLGSMSTSVLEGTALGNTLGGFDSMMGAFAIEPQNRHLLAVQAPMVVQTNGDGGHGGQPTYSFLQTTSDNLPWRPLDSVAASYGGYLANKAGKTGDIISRVAGAWTSASEKLDSVTRVFVDPIKALTPNLVPDLSGRSSSDPGYNRSPSVQRHVQDGQVQPSSSSTSTKSPREAAQQAMGENYFGSYNQQQRPSYDRMYPNPYGGAASEYYNDIHRDPLPGIFDNMNRNGYRHDASRIDDLLDWVPELPTFWNGGTNRKSNNFIEELTDDIVNWPKWIEQLVSSGDKKVLTGGDEVVFTPSNDEEDRRTSTSTPLSPSHQDGDVGVTIELDFNHPSDLDAFEGNDPYTGLLNEFGVPLGSLLEWLALPVRPFNPPNEIEAYAEEPMGRQHSSRHTPFAEQFHPHDDRFPAKGAQSSRPDPMTNVNQAERSYESTGTIAPPLDDEDEIQAILLHLAHMLDLFDTTIGMLDSMPDTDSREYHYNFLNDGTNPNSDTVDGLESSRRRLNEPMAPSYQPFYSHLPERNSFSGLGDASGVASNAWDGVALDFLGDPGSNAAAWTGFDGLPISGSAPWPEFVLPSESSETNAGANCANGDQDCDPHLIAPQTVGLPPLTADGAGSGGETAELRPEEVLSAVEVPKSKAEPSTQASDWVAAPRLKIFSLEEITANPDRVSEAIREYLANWEKYLGVSLGLEEGSAEPYQNVIDEVLEELDYEFKKVVAQNELLPALKLTVPSFTSKQQSMSVKDYIFNMLDALNLARLTNAREVMDWWRGATGDDTLMSPRDSSANLLFLLFEPNRPAPVLEYQDSGIMEPNGPVAMGSILPVGFMQPEKESKLLDTVVTSELSATAEQLASLANRGGPRTDTVKQLSFLSADENVRNTEGLMDMIIQAAKTGMFDS